MIDDQKNLKPEDIAHIKKQARKRKQMNFMKKFVINISPHDYKGMTFLGNYKHSHPKIPFQDELRDNRLVHLTSQYFINKQVLDIGCGTGLVAIEISIRSFPDKIVLLDIDDYVLIQAKRKIDKIVQVNAKYKALSEDLVVAKRISQFPIFFQDEFKKDMDKHHFKFKSTVEIVPEKVIVGNEFPKNVCFLNDNIFNIKETEAYDTVICFGVLKWIHLSFGDNGFEKFFYKIFEVLKFGGILIVEYALLRSYKKKKHYNLLFQQNMNNHIKIEPQAIPKNIGYLGFELVHQITKGTPQYPIKHPIAILRKKSPEIPKNEGPLVKIPNSDKPEEIEMNYQQPPSVEKHNENDEWQHQ